MCSSRNPPAEQSIHIYDVGSMTIEDSTIADKSASGGSTTVAGIFVVGSLANKAAVAFLRWIFKRDQAAASGR
jgi:hypothetical protein